MFTNEDFISYFAELEIIERNMHDLYEEVIKNVTDPEVRKVFEGLMNAESSHSTLVEEIKRIAMRKSLSSK